MHCSRKHASTLFEFMHVLPGTPGSAKSTEFMHALFEKSCAATKKLLQMIASKPRGFNVVNW